jgi:hypothetical protein
MKLSAKFSRNGITWVANATFFFSFFLSVILAEADPPVPLHLLLNSTLCEGRCVDGCKSYVTPLNQCFNGQSLFPDDPSWGVYDISDIVLSSDLLNESASFSRQFFGSKDGNCTGGPTDSFILPIYECVGPFGAPRPWGEFSFLWARTTKNETPLII